ncbi:MAG TPA: hypothetical protein VMW43_03305 [Bacteroidota bacterium]|nr:hypothetical protein [Bacteroidota bacterium]
MLSIGGSLGLMLFALLLGKRKRRPGFPTYVAVFLIALAQVSLVLYEMYTMSKPLG